MSWNKTDSLEMMESENNRLADNLAGKISRLKMISLDMKDDINDDNRYLDGMGSDMLSTTGLLTGSTNRFKKMINSGQGNRKIICRIVVFVVLAFLVIYFILSRKS